LIKGVNVADRGGAADAGGLRILAIGAHPDDIELGCGGSLAKLTRLGALVRAMIYSRGRRGNLTEEDRQKETETALARIGITDVHVYDFGDTNLSRHLNDLIRIAEQHVAEHRPERVYTMFDKDRHQDHRAVHEASIIACRRVKQILGYETPSSYPNFRPTAFEDIEGFLETKIDALRCHRSQGERLYMQEEKIRSAAHFRGVQVDRGPCEGFVPYKLIF
jgi:LmbE family N-acetylglucosaminyl deacetylase